MKGESHGSDSPTPSSITTPSSTDDDDLAPDSDYGDGANPDSEYGEGDVTWPWMEYIQENGDLLYVDSYYEDSGQDETPKETLNDITSKEGGIQRKLRNAIKKSSSDVRQTSIKSGSSNKSSNSNKSSSSLKTSLQEIFFQKVDKNPVPAQQAIVQKYEKVEQISEDVNLISRNVLLQLGNTVEKDFINLENVFGIISGLNLDSIVEKKESRFPAYKRNLNAIVVQGIIPSSPAGRCTDIVIDDVIVAVNGIDVDIKNIDIVLAQVNGVSEVVLKIQRIVDHCTDDSKSELCAIVSNDIWDGREMVFRAFGEMCAVMYLTLDANEDEPESDILFWYPDSPLVEKLKCVRGIFLTLNDVMINVSGSKVESSILMIDGKVVNIYYEKFNSDVFVVAVPNEKCSMINLQRKSCQFLQVLNVLYGDLAASFSTEMLLSMKHLIQKYADILLQEEELINIGIKQLQLTTQQYTDVSTLLTDAESSDYGECADDFFPHQRLYGTIGTCLFYKDVLVCNHLCNKLLKVVIYICTYHWLFALVKKEKLNQLIFWKELFLGEIIGGESASDDEVRWFLLIVGQGRSLFCTLLQTGGVASIPDGNPGPHPFYVDTAWSILKYLLEVMEVETVCNSSLDVTSMPAIVTPLQVLNLKTSQSPRALELTRRKVTSSTDAFNRKNSLVEYYNDGQIENPMFDKTFSRGSSVSSSSSHVITNEYNYFDTSSKSSNPEHSTTTALSTKLTIGMSNSLFCFTILQPYSGIFISPNILETSDTFTNEIMLSFKSSCETIHQMFELKDGPVRQIEHGILFHIESTRGAELKKGLPNVRYWVVGRRVKCGISEEEVYVCFEDGVPQNVIEMAFKMRFGCYY